MCFGLAPLPAIPPIADEELEAEGVNLHARLEADTKVSIIHLVLLGVGE